MPRRVCVLFSPALHVCVGHNPTQTLARSWLTPLAIDYGVSYKSGRRFDLFPQAGFHQYYGPITAQPSSHRIACHSGAAYALAVTQIFRSMPGTVRRQPSTSGPYRGLIGMLDRGVHRRMLPVFSQSSPAGLVQCMSYASNCYLAVFDLSINADKSKPIECACLTSTTTTHEGIEHKAARRCHHANQPAH